MYSNMILIYSMRIVAKPIPLIRNNEGDAIAIAETQGRILGVNFTI